MLSHTVRRFIAIASGVATVVLLCVNAPSPSAGAAVTTPVAAPISVGTGFVCATVASADVNCFGVDTSDELGEYVGNLTATPTPVGFNSASAVSSGGDASCALLFGGTIECWGSGSQGQLGDGSTSAYSVPTSVDGISTATSVSMGSGFACATLNNGTADCWGSNGSGQLGDASTNSESVPQTVLGLTNAVQISAGSDFACALLTTGGVDCWGDNTYGELGDGSNDDSDVPVVVSSITNAIQVSAGQDGACALLSTNTIDCWGGNTDGDLGDGSVDASNTPTSVEANDDAPLSGVTSVSMGDDFTCATLISADVDCWGDGANGQLGNGNDVNSDTPVEVLDLASATAVSAGGSSACAVTSSGTLNCWGANSLDELGTPNSVTESSDVPLVVSGLTVGTPEPTYTVTYDSEGGVVSPASANYTVGDSDLTLPTPTLAGYMFEGWYTSALGGTLTSSPYVPSASITLYAQWRHIVEVDDVTLDAQGGSVSPSIETYSPGDAALTLPTPTQTGYTFDGWFSATSGGTLDSSPYTPSSSTTLYAQWTPDTYVVAFDSEGGSSVHSLSFTVGAAALTLPTPSRSGYTFDGWLSSASGGVRENSPYTPSESTTLFAVWKLKAPTSPRSVTINRVRTVVSVHWSTEATATHFVCTLTSESSSAYVRHATVTINHCTFSVPNSPVSYRVSVVASNSAGSSSASRVTLAR